MGEGLIRYSYRHCEENSATEESRIRRSNLRMFNQEIASSRIKGYRLLFSPRNDVIRGFIPTSSFLIPNSSFLRIRSHRFAFGEDVAVHGVQQLIAGGFAGNVNLRVERIEFEIIPVRLPRRRTRAAVAHLLEIVHALPRAVRELIALREIFCKSALSRGNVIDDPMNISSAGRVWVFEKNREALSSLWRAAPGKRGRDVLALTGILLWYGGIVLKCGRCDLHVRVC